MAEIYGTFAFALGVLLVLGMTASRASIHFAALDKVSILVTVLVSVTAAGLLSTAFVADAFADDAAGPIEFFTDKTARDSLGMVMWLVAAGASGLLFTLVLVAMDSVAPKRRWLAATVEAIRRWTGGALVVATLAVVLLFPAVLVVIFTAADIAHAT